MESILLKDGRMDIHGRYRYRALLERLAILASHARLVLLAVK
jgi:hypothetical protein